jgi:hypothetical protein
MRSKRAVHPRRRASGGAGRVPAMLAERCDGTFARSANASLRGDFALDDGTARSALVSAREPSSGTSRGGERGRRPGGPRSGPTTFADPSQQDKWDHRSNTDNDPGEFEAGKPCQ